MSKRHLLEDVQPPAQRAVETRDLQQLWFALARRPWTTLVLAPAGRDGSAEDVARSLADVGKNLSDVPVMAIGMSRLGAGSARALATLNETMRRDQPAGTRFQDGVVEVFPFLADMNAPDSGKLIIAIPALVSEPLGLAVTRSADAVILSVELGRTTLADARRSLDLIGRERVAGCYLLS